MMGLFNHSRLSILIWVMLMSGLSLSFDMPNDVSLEYIITRKGEDIGKLHFSKKVFGNRVYLKMKSDVQFRILARITAHAKEEAEFQNNILLSSSVYREINGFEKSNKQTRILGSDYTLHDDGEKKLLKSYPIQYNMLCIYLNEPLQQRRIYSDNYQRFLPIQYIEPHHYRIELPNGDVNDYYYKNGVCILVDVKSTLYHSSIRLKSA
jgi:hypothetical protein